MTARRQYLTTNDNVRKEPTMNGLKDLLYRSKYDNGVCNL